MKRSKQLFIGCITILAGCATSSFSLADCGEKPIIPELPDGKTATMDMLVETSNAVKTFISSADTYLDCGEKEVLTDEFKALETMVQEERKKELRDLLKERNSIAEDFNNEVAAYKKAHPE